jgi:hypothetical protein
MPGFAVRGVILELFGRQKGLKICVGSGRWCQVLGVVFGALVIIKETKAPAMAGAFGGVV